MSDSFSFLPTHAALRPLPEASDALPIGATLGEFLIREVVGVGGFGIVYRAWEAALEREVALKEYMPMGLVRRAAEGQLTLRSAGHAEDFQLGLKSFVNEARLLARFDHPALVKVHRFWEGNGTAYMAMPFYRAQTLRQRRQAMGLQAPTQDWLLSMIEPLLGALAEMHRVGVYHRDIAPDNILWCEDERPVLLDFGAARQVLADRTQSLTAILKPQFSPIEQYADSKPMRQGPWTDLFALASTCYFMLTGRPPVPATARVLSDELASLAQLAPSGFSLQVLATLDWAMSVRPEDRPQSVTAFRDALHGHLKVPVRGARASVPSSHVGASDGRVDATRAYAPTTAAWMDVSPTGLTAMPGAMAGADLPALGAALARPASPARDFQRTKRVLVLAAAAAVAAASAVVRSWQAPATAQVPVAASAVAPAASEAPSWTAVAAVPSMTTATAASSAPDRPAPSPPEPVQQAAAIPPARAAASVPAVSHTSRASAPSRRLGARDTCRRAESSDLNACVKRLCESDARFKRDKACTGKPARHWWQFGMGG